jgi:predicted GTPase
VIDLPQYEQFKFELAEIVRDVKRSSDPESERRYQELSVRLATDQFNIVVAGRFSRGKTSLMNAVLGSDWLPTGIVPLTSVITTVRYGTRERVLIEYETGGLRSDVPLTELRKYVTEEGNPGNRMRVKVAEVQLPAELLRRGFCFVDTPGLGSAIAANELTTERYIPEIDALILVTSFEGPLSDDEIRFLQLTKNGIKKVFVIINKSDLASPDEKEQVRQFVETRLGQELKGILPKMFCVSAREGLEARRRHNQDELAVSGVQEVENALIEFMTTEKMAELLLLVCDRLLNILRMQPQTEQLEAIRTRVVDIQSRIPGGQIRAEERTVRESALVAAVATRDLHDVPACDVCRSILNAVVNKCGNADETCQLWWFLFPAHLAICEIGIATGNLHGLPGFACKSSLRTRRECRFGGGYSGNAESRRSHLWRILEMPSMCGGFGGSAGGSDFHSLSHRERVRSAGTVSTLLAAYQAGDRVRRSECGEGDYSSRIRLTAPDK